LNEAKKRKEAELVEAQGELAELKKSLGVKA
jgi:hypothetical protein